MMTARADDEQREMRCRGCAYDLRGLAEHRCPECGRGFDPADARTFLHRPVRAQYLLILAIVSVPVAAWPYLMIPFELDRRIHWIGIVGAISTFGGLVMASKAAWRSISILRGRDQWVTHRWAAPPAAALGVAVVSTFLLVMFSVIVYTFFLN